MFYSDGTNFVVNSSADNVTWYGKATVKATVANGSLMSVAFDGTYFHYVYFNAGNTGSYRRGTPNADGTITWSAAEQTITLTASHTGANATICVSTGGKAFVGYRDYDGSANYYPAVINNANTDGTWTTENTNVLQSTTSDNTWVCIVVPLTGGKVYAAYTRTGAGAYGKQWSGSAWGSEENIDTSAYNSASTRVSLSSYGDDLFYFWNHSTTYRNECKKRASGTWGSAEDATTGTSYTDYGQAAVDPSNGDVYYFYVLSSVLYYTKRTNAGGSWGGAQTVVSEANINNSGRTPCFFNIQSSKIGVAYLVGTSNPYTVKYAVIPFTSAVDLKGGRLILTSGSVVATAYSSSVPGAVIVAPLGLTLDSASSIDCTGIRVVECNGSCDTSAGMFTQATGAIALRGVGTLKLAAGQKLYDLVGDGLVTLGSNVTVDRTFAHANPVIKGAYALTLTDPTKEMTGLRMPLRKAKRRYPLNSRSAPWMDDILGVLAYE